MKQYTADFRAAVMFLTLLPAGRDGACSPVGMIKFFPLVGLVLGTFLAGFDLLVSLFWPPGVVAILDVILLIVFTGAFHLDGLGDAADGLFSHRSKEKALKIMKDSRIGMMGLVVVVCVLALKVAGIYAIKSLNDTSLTFMALWVVPAYSRASMIFGICFLKYGRKNTGTGLDLFENRLNIKDFTFLLLPMMLSLLSGAKGLLLMIIFFGIVIILLGFYKKKMNCITGDMLGAMTEVVEAGLFFAAGAGIV